MWIDVKCTSKSHQQIESKSRFLDQCSSQLFNTLNRDVGRKAETEKKKKYFKRERQTDSYFLFEWKSTSNLLSWN